MEYAILILKYERDKLNSKIVFIKEFLRFTKLNEEIDVNYRRDFREEDKLNEIQNLQQDIEKIERAIGALSR
ncbi:hypothetical protein [Paenibacillus xylaniclasticus]|uniref:hypothetical protein n=1 Tax=Paenibacillus xylaniclasticus TaxID=588083 RepID=UPI000FD743E9|nr:MULTISPECIES: hypothetical protein [Paenibacillus]GFN32459.1 hypothetical protein PCURB6_27190 [Paenibacillus curdlanolyticus]